MRKSAHRKRGNETRPRVFTREHKPPARACGTKQAVLVVVITGAVLAKRAYIGTSTVQFLVAIKRWASV